MLMASIDASIVLISLPDIFRGIKLNPLTAGNTSYFLWMLMGYMLVTAVLVVSFGRLGDIFGRVRMYNMGFAIFTVFSIMLSVTWMHGSSAALFMIIMRVFQGVGGAFIMANSTAILTDAFPPNSAASRWEPTWWQLSRVPSSGSCSAVCWAPSTGAWFSWSRSRWASSAPSGASSTWKTKASAPRPRSTGWATPPSPSAWWHFWSESFTASSPTTATPWDGPTRWSWLA
jgi:MFS family permease